MKISLGYVFNNYFQSNYFQETVVSCPRGRKGVFVYLQKSICLFTEKKTIISTMKNRVRQNEIRKFLNEFSYFCDTPMHL